MNQHSPDNIFDRFAERLVLGPIPEACPERGPCWLWDGTKNKKGYGRLGWGRETEAYRVAYLILIGPIPPGKEMHHHCRNRACVNGYHLEPVTHQENCITDFKKDACPNGHPYVEGSFYEYPTPYGGSYRTCKVCAREKSSKRFAANKELIKAQSAARYLKNREAVSIAAALYYQKRKALKAAANPAAAVT